MWVGVGVFVPVIFWTFYFCVPLLAQPSSSCRFILIVAVDNFLSQTYPPLDLIPSLSSFPFPPSPFLLP